MGDVREELVELIISSVGGCSRYWAGVIADGLIAGGVTIQRWIPVTERLPEASTTVNLYTRSRTVGTGFCDKHTKSWVQYYSGGAICVDVTHWQPMPQPVKENDYGQKPKTANKDLR